MGAYSPDSADAGAGESVVRARRNASAARSGVLIAKGGAGATVKCNRSRRGDDTKGAEH